MTGDDIHRILENGEYSPMSLLMAILAPNPICEFAKGIFPNGGLWKLLSLLVYWGFWVASIPIHAVLSTLLVGMRILSGCGKPSENFQLLAAIAVLAFGAALLFGPKVFGVLRVFGIDV